jgi:hypothetical protein
MQRQKLLLSLIGSLFILSSCMVPIRPADNQPVSMRAEADASEIPQKPTLASPSPTPTLEPIQVTATVFEEMPMVPIVMYHRFDPAPYAYSEQYKTSLSDLDAHLQALYDAGYSLVALDDWLQGEIKLPEGRRPLIITIDDLFYADQISLDETGEPAPYSGIGRVWQFYKQHPDFNFHLALFYNFGDKGYANGFENGAFFIKDGWLQDRAEAIAWAIKNGAIPYNHFYNHPNLSLLSPDEIRWHLDENEKALQEALALVDEVELADDLANILALPYVIWPETDAGKQVLFDYQSPSGAPVLAILEANDGDLVRPLPAPYAETFDSHHVKRLSGIQAAVDAIVKKADEIPPAIKCNLGEMPGDILSHPDQIASQILNLTRQGDCPEGYFTIGSLVFFVDANEITQVWP